MKRRNQLSTTDIPQKAEKFDFEQWFRSNQLRISYQRNGFQDFRIGLRQSGFGTCTLPTLLEERPIERPGNQDPKDQITWRLINHSRYSQPVGSTESSQATSKENLKDDSKDDSKKIDLGNLIDAATSTYMRACFEVPMDRECKSILIEGHQNPEKWRPRHTKALMKTIVNIQDIVAKFSIKSELFQSLTKADQETLYLHNSPLFLHYLLARFFLASTGFDQLTWILGCELPLESGAQLLNASPMSLVQLCENEDFLTLIQPSLIPFQQIAKIIKSITNDVDLPSYYNGLVLQTLLFNVNENIDLEQPQRVKSIFDESKRAMTQSNIGKGSMDFFIKSIIQLQVIFESRNINCLIKLEDNTQEHLWNQHVFKTYRSVIDDIAPDSLYINAYKKALQGDKKYFADGFALNIGLFSLRFQNILNFFTGTSLSMQERATIALRNYGIAYILSFIKTSHCEKSLFNFVLGRKNKGLEGLGIIPMRYAMQVMFPLEELELVFYLVDAIKRSIEDDEVLILTILYLLLDGSSQVGIQKCFLKAIYHKMEREQMNLTSHLNNLYRFKAILKKFVKLF